MAAVQPFLSGAISKTCNVPNEATVEDIRDAYLEGWRLGLKALAIYRDGSKGSQPVSTKSETDQAADAAAAAAVASQATQPVVAPAESLAEAVPSTNVQPRRERLPHTRRSMTHKFDIQGHEGYVDFVGFYPDGRPGEVFITMAKEGSTIGGLMDVIGTSISIGLQYGVPLEGLRLEQVRPQPVLERRPQVHQEPRYPDRQEHHGLHLPLAGNGVHSLATVKPTLRSDRPSRTITPPPRRSSR